MYMGMFILFRDIVFVTAKPIYIISAWQWMKAGLYYSQVDYQNIKPLPRGGFKPQRNGQIVTGLLYSSTKTQ